MNEAIFAGLKVIDCASFIAAPIAATILSDFGAEVVKIEPPGQGDPYRRLSSAPGYPISEHNYCWMLGSRNKRSLALDLTKPDGQAVLHRLVAEADVFITNMPLPVRGRLGIGYEKLRPLNSRMIYASFTGYGETGEEANKPGFDSNAWWARSGLMDMVRPTSESLPARSMPGMGDHPSGVALYAAIVTALFRRAHTGEGSHVSTSLIANGVWSNGCMAQASLCGAKFLERPPRDKARNAIAHHYRCRDGRWILLSLLNEQRQWPVLAKCLGREDLVADPRFATDADRRKNSPALIAILDETFAARDLAEWRKKLDAAGLVFGFMALMPDLPHDRQMQEAGAFVPFDGAGDGALTIDSPIFIGGVTKKPAGRAPELGEHSDEVLRELGYDDAAIAAMREASTVG